jgi:NMD protein affecting ribosome stability and mRNA decay
MKDKLRVELEMNQKMCSDCKKTSSEYYEFKLQLRFVFFNLEKLNIIKEEIFDLINNNFNTINKFEDKEEKGFNFYFRNLSQINKTSNLLNKRYFCEEKRSKKIVGRNFLISKDIWRHTLLIKIINLNRRDQILVKGEKYIIENISKKTLVLRNMEDNSKKVINYLIFKDYIEKIND